MISDFNSWMIYSVSVVYLEQYRRKGMNLVRDIFTFGYTEFVAPMKVPSGNVKLTS